MKFAEITSVLHKSQQNEAARIGGPRVAAISDPDYIPHSAQASWSAGVPPEPDPLARINGRRRRCQQNAEIASRAPVKRGVVCQNGRMEALQRLPRVDAELVGEQVAGPPVGGQRLGPAARTGTAPA